MRSIMSEMGNANYGKKFVNIPNDLSDNILLNNCDKIYLDFGLIPYSNSMANIFTSFKTYYQKDSHLR